MLAGACIATLTVAGNSYVVRTTADALRGRVFTALESVIRVSLLLSMIVMAPLGRLHRQASSSDFVEQQRACPTTSVYLTGSRITLQVCSLIVLGAAVYAFKTLSWRAGRAECEPVRAAEEAADA